MPLTEEALDRYEALEEQIAELQAKLKPLTDEREAITKSIKAYLGDKMTRMRGKFRLAWKTKKGRVAWKALAMTHAPVEAIQEAQRSVKPTRSLSVINTQSR